MMHLDGCGHDHPEGECACGHHHHHGECGHHHGENQVIVGIMGNAVLGTLTALTTVDISVTEVNMHRTLKDLAAWVQSEGGFINQLKTSMKNDHMTVILTMLGEDIFRKEGHESTETNPSKVKINLLLVVHNIEPEAVKTKLESLLQILRKD